MLGMSKETKIVRVGVASWIVNPADCVLLGLRKSAHGAGTWAPPGGHLEFGETPKDAAIRETIEETGLDLYLDNVQFRGFTNDIFSAEDKHYITMHFVTRIHREMFAKLREPDKCIMWRWFPRYELPRNLFAPAAQFLQQHTL